MSLTTASTNFAILSQSLGRRMFCHALERCQVIYPDTKELLRKQAGRMAWKILSDWTEVECSMILLGQAKPLQMFLPFVYDMKANETLFDKVSAGKMKLLPG